MIIVGKILSFDVIGCYNSAPIDVTANQNQAITSPKHFVEKESICLLFMDFDECENQTNQSHRQKCINAQTFVSQTIIDNIF